MRNTWNWITAAIICAGLLAGCGGDNAEEEGPRQPDGPKEVALAMLHAIGAGDGGTAVAYYDCSPEDKEYLVKTMPFRQALIRLGNAGAKAYGADAWETAKDKANIREVVPDMDNARKNIQCEITGDTAICYMKGFSGALTLAKRGATWMVVPQEGQFPPLHMRGDILKSILATTAAIDAITPKIGAKNVSADDICTEVKKVLNIQ
jgi:hypothetical protein